ncbi:sugar transferase [Beduini massiliensis]|uniref:sugar transferase n=1 Tax=Beduini massiliensis TaxID=1585974 RepID=UPI0009E44C46|nr:sugar transferase [Beduini massiliensis]
MTIKEREKYDKNLTNQYKKILTHPEAQVKEKNKSKYLLCSDHEYEEYFKNEISKHKSNISYEPKPFYECFKRTMDILFCLITCIPALLIIGFFCILIVYESEGNPIFSQIRVGKNGKLIKIHKLRSMKVDAEKEGQKWAELNDPRITKIGRIIRKYRIDELPQLFDVLTGKMSLIGPRPEVPSLTYRFNEENPGFVTRLMVTPGLSGMAQVYGKYDTPPKEKWQKDCQYIENRSFVLYINIFFLTIKTVFCGEGAR